MHGPQRPGLHLVYVNFILVCQKNSMANFTFFIDVYLLYKWFEDYIEVLSQKIPNSVRQREAKLHSGLKGPRLQPKG